MLEFEHVFACEEDVWRRDLILSEWKPSFLFTDIVDMDKLEAYDYISRSQHIIPTEIDGLAAGISCKSVSALNTSARNNKCCVQHGTGQTGLTADGSLKCVKKVLPSFCFLENVMNCNGAKFEAAVRRLNELGYIVWSHTFSAITRGVPQRRMRLWAIGFRVQKSALNQFDAAFRFPAWYHDIDQIMMWTQVDPLPLDRCLFTDDELSNWWPETSEVAAGGKRRKPDGQCPAWKAEHLESFRAKNLAWPIDWGQHAELGLCVAKLTDR